MSDQAVVVWITGLSGSGKSTIAKELVQNLKLLKRNVIYLDGDILRQILNEEKDYSMEKRQALSNIYGKLCKEISSQGTDVVCATISMFDAVRKWNRLNIQNYYEIYLKVPLSELQKRDTKGLYLGFKKKSVSNLVGVDNKIEEPKNPDLIINNYGVIDTQTATNNIINKLKPNLIKT